MQMTVEAVTKDKRTVEYIKSTTPGILKSRNLLCNEDKTEQHVVNRYNRYGTWSKYKYLGSKLDTEEDMKNCTILGTTAMNNLTEIWTSNVSIEKRMEIFNSFIRSVYMYNSCLWSMDRYK